MEQIYIPKQDYKVLVRCITYNQAKYIEDALNGFAMQKTDFPFVCLIVDDCSTDGEIEVIKSWMERECDMTRAEYEEIEYSNIILVPHKTNPTCTFAFYFLKRNLYKEPEKKQAMYNSWREHCQYEALCEGDDYWITYNKLQLQYDILEKNKKINMCAHAHKTIFVNSPQCVTEEYYKNRDTLITLKETILGEGGIVATASLFMRTDMVLSVPDYRKKMDYDYTLQIQGATPNGMYYIANLMSVYRAQVANSFTSKLRDSQVAEKYLRDKCEILDILDTHLNYNFHNVIQGRKMLYFINSNNSAVRNFGYLIKYWKGFFVLSFTQKVLLIIKCFVPFIIRLYRKLKNDCSN